MPRGSAESIACTVLRRANMSVSLFVRLHSCNGRLRTDAAQCLGRRLAKRRLVRCGESSKLVEPVVGRDAGDRVRWPPGMLQRESHALQPLGEHPSLRAHAVDVVKRVAKAALAESDHAAKAGDGHRSLRAFAQAGLDSL